MEPYDASVDLLSTKDAVLGQLDSRLRIPTIDERDGLAIETAVQHAMMRGFRLGFEAAHSKHQKYLDERVGDIELPRPEYVDDEEVDLWEERYGREDE